MKQTRIFFKPILIFTFLCRIAFAHEVIVNTETETFSLEYDPCESLEMLTEKVTSLIDKADNLLIEISPEDPNLINVWQVKMRHQGHDLGKPRNFYAEMTPQEENDIRYIVKTLANKSMIALAPIMRDLDAAGDRIDRIHPLRFLMTVFSDEEMKVGVRNIRTKRWVWKNFVGGLKGSLSAEANYNNMKEEYVLAFAECVEIDSALITPSIQSHSWDKFINLLIEHVPRKGDYDRYDC